MILPIVGDTLSFKKNEYLITNIDAKKALCTCTSIKNTKIKVDVFFKNIQKINEVKVEYIKARNIFSSYGTIKRKADLPNKNDIIALEKSVAVVDHIKVVGGEIIIVDTDKVKHKCKDITDIDYVDYGKFNKKTFLETYADYI